MKAYGFERPCLGWKIENGRLLVSPQVIKFLNKNITNFWFAIARKSRANVLREIRKNKDNSNFQIETQLCNGRWVLIDVQNNEYGTYGHIMDISNYVQEKELYAVKSAEAEQISKAKSLFIANLSHDLRAPLNGIIGMAEFLKETKLSIEQDRYAKNIITASKMLLALVNDILDIAKIEAGKLVLENTIFNLPEVLQCGKDMVLSMAQQKNLSVDMYLDIRLPEFLKGDSTRLQQVYINLLSNAIKFTQHGGVSIIAKVVELTHEDCTIHFEIKDTGIGISEESLKNIFQDFTQGSTATTRKYGGTGLGLSISKKIVTLMNGMIDVKSKVGEGSSFYFDIKFALAEGARSVLQESNKQLNILLVEDNIINQEVMAGLLQRIGDNVTIANNGQEAVDIFNTQTFDLILMDVNMPVMNGIQATEMIRKLPNGKSVPIIAVTANTMIEDKEDCIKHGMNDVTTKPISKTKLENLLLPYRGSIITSSAVEIFNMQTISALKENLGDERVAKLMNIYRRDVPEILQNILNANNAEGKSLAHTLAGMSENLGIDGIGKIARELMLAYNNNNDKEIAELKPKLYQQLTETFATMESATQC